ncbi:phosphotransferase family protein [Streptomyces sp. x-80]|uniref:phosphotransferase family protein n=1 Tax=Streptomyces sp. x-80 TaxID=2789282 RepID=UPI0039808554
MAGGGNVGAPATDIGDQGWAATRTWVEKALPEGDRIVAVERLSGGWTSEMRRLRVAGTGEPRWLVLRSFAKPFFVRHAAGLLTREAAVLSPLRGTDVPAATFHAVDATAAHCDHPSLLMSLLPGSVRLGAEGAGERAELLARQLVRIHRQRISAADRPRTYQAWTAPDRVRVPEGTDHPELWRRAVDVIRREPPEYRACLLHRDFHPGNVLFDGQGDALRITGVVDWVETSWGPADWDVAHCATALALLHGARAGMLFADHYLAAGGRLAAEPAGHLYWRMLDALAFAPDAEKVAIPWRELGRADLSPALLGDRLEAYLRELLRRYG